MPNLLFNRLTVASDTLESANQFVFNPQLNLITGNDNSIGKSTLAKLLFWTLGCNPAFDQTWNSFDVRAHLEFSIDGRIYQAVRYGNSISITDSNAQWRKFPKITGEYSALFSDIVNFKALLPNREDATRLETPPPSYYFLPFYIDQRLSWSHAWSGFPGLEQYARWQKNIIEYHTGYLLPAYFELEELIARNSTKQKEAETEVKKIETALEVVKQYVPVYEKTIALSTDDLTNLTQELEGQLTTLQLTQEECLRGMAEIQAEKQYLNSQLQLAIVARSELDKDYAFTVENVAGDALLCPLCGTVHDNSLASRASILADKDEADTQVTEIERKIKSLDKRLEKIKRQVDAIQVDIERINQKYVPQQDGTDAQQTTINLIDGLASRAVQTHVSKSLQSNSAVIVRTKGDNRKLRKEQKTIVTKDERKEMDAYFKGVITGYIDLLNATGVNLSNVESALDYKKLYGSGGAAESTRGLLAYFMAVISQIKNANNEVMAPIVIDTVNQHEQTNLNYQSIIRFLDSTLPSGSQLILCAMESPQIKSYRDKAHVIALDNDKLLKKEKYKSLRPAIQL